MKVRGGLGELSLTTENIETMERFARAQNLRDYFLLALMGRRGLRISETLQVTRERLQNGGVLVMVKGGEMMLKILPPTLYQEMLDYSKPLPKMEQLIPVGRRQAYNLCQKYAKLAGIEQWQRAHPHRWRHYFGTFYARKTGRDPWKVKSLMGHKDLRATAIYVDNLSPEEELAELT
jgi:integrase